MKCPFCHVVKEIRYADHLETVRSLLESLPLSTGDYGIAQNRLRNAERYLRSQEHGAARFELQMLAGSLQNGSPK